MKRAARIKERRGRQSPARVRLRRTEKLFEAAPGLVKSHHEELKGGKTGLGNSATTRIAPRLQQGQRKKSLPVSS